MKQITYKDKQYNVPTCWDDITLEDQIMAEQLIKQIGDELSLIGLISAYTNLPISVIKEGDVGTINEINQIMSFIYDGYTPMPIESFKHRGHEYFLQELTQSQFQDFLSLNVILQNNEGNLIKALPRLIAVMAKRKGETLDDYELDEREKEFMDLPLSTAKSVEGFFLLKSQELKSLIVLSTKDFQEKLLSIKFQLLRNTMKESRKRHGKFSLMRFAIGIYLIILNYLEKRLVRFYNLQYLNKSKTTSNKTWWKRKQIMREKK